MKKTVLIVTLMEHGHLWAFAGITENLEKLGYKVLMLCNSESQEMVEKLGFQSFVFTLNYPIKQYQRDWRIYLAMGCLKYNSFEELLKEQEIGCLLADDHMAVAALLGYKLAIPVATVCIHLPLNYNGAQNFAPSQFYSAPFANDKDRSLFETGVWQVYRAHFGEKFELYIRKTKELIRQISYPIDLVSDDTPTYPFLIGYPCLILASSGFEYPDSNCTHNIYCGPAFTSKVAAICQKDANESKPNERPLFVVSMGSQTKHYANAEKTLQMLVEAFARHPEWDVVASFGAHLDPMTNFLKQHYSDASHIKYDSWIDQATLIRRAAVLVTHGGISSVKEAIYNFVPMLVVPQAYDQFGNAARVEFHKIGIALPSNPTDWVSQNASDVAGLEDAKLCVTDELKVLPDVTVDRIEAALCSLLLEDKFKMNVTRLGRVSRQEQQQHVASKFIHNLIQNNTYPCVPSKKIKNNN